MKKIMIVMLALALALMMIGCAAPAGPTGVSTEDETNAGTASGSGDSADAGGASADSDTDSAQQALSPGGPSQAEFEGIDWNTDAYNTYFRVESGEAVIHYWDGGQTALMQVPDMLMYVSGSTSIAVDLRSGTVSTGFGGGFIPPASADEQAPGQGSITLGDYSFIDIFMDEDMYVFTFEVEGGTASYYVNRSLVCVGWTYESDEGDATYFLADDRSFESVVDSAFREYADGTTSGGNEKYADTDGDGYSDWNLDRKPSSEEFDYLTDLWKSEGLSGTEYFEKIDELMGFMVDTE